MWSWGIPVLLHMWDPDWTQRAGQFTPLFLPDSLLSSQCTTEIGDHLGSLLWKSSEGTFTTPNERLQRGAEIKSAEFTICLGPEPNSVYNARSMLESQHQVGLGCPPCAFLEPSSAFMYFCRSIKLQCGGKLPSFSVIWGRKMLSMPLALKGTRSLIYKLGWCGGGRRAELPSPSCCLSDAELVLQLLSAALVRSQCAGIAQKVKICWLNFLQLPTQKAS